MIKNRFVLIDAFALIFRAYYALPPTLTKDGHSIAAAYGFASALLSSIRTLQPEYLAVGMEYPKPTLRHKEFKDYKAHRPAPPEDLVKQIPYVKELLKTMNIPTYSIEGYEGEDVIATIIAKTLNSKLETLNKSQITNSKNTDNLEFRISNLEFVVVTGDMDCLQLVDEQTEVYSMARGINQSQMYDTEKVKEKYGLLPEQFVDYKALKGDPSDNIPGVPGVGEKTAIKLIQEFGTLDNLYSVIASEAKQSDHRSPQPTERRLRDDIEKIQKSFKISEKTLKILLENKEQAFLSQKLSKINPNAPLEFKLSDARIHHYNQKETIALFGKLGFKSLIARLPDEAKIEEDASMRPKLF